MVYTGSAVVKGEDISSTRYEIENYLMKAILLSQNFVKSRDAVSLHGRVQGRMPTGMIQNLSLSHSAIKTKAKHETPHVALNG